MTAEELRIGNFVEEYGTVEIVGLRTFKQYLEMPKIMEDSIKPIELTEKWLKDFSFEYDGSYWRPKGCWHRYVFHQRFLFTNVLNLEPEGCIVPHAHVYYVHQLQNLYFALTEKELKTN